MKGSRIKNFNDSSNKLSEMTIQKQLNGQTSHWYFKYEECGVLKYYKRNGVEELSQYRNYGDYLQSKIFGLGMQNPEHMGVGDDVCTEYFKQGRVTVLPDNLKDIETWR